MRCYADARTLTLLLTQMSSNCTLDYALSIKSISICWEFACFTTQTIERFEIMLYQCKYTIKLRFITNKIEHAIICDFVCISRTKIWRDYINSLSWRTFQISGYFKFYSFEWHHLCTFTPLTIMFSSKNSL